jgi:hypothetical protein
MEDHTENKPAATVTMFGDEYLFCETFAPDSPELTAQVTAWKNAGHRTAQKKNKADAQLIDLYVRQKKG